MAAAPIIRQTGRSIVRVEFDASAPGWEQWVLLSGDRHHDSPAADHARERRQLDLVEHRDALIIDVGDMHDLCGGRGDPRRSRSVVRPEHQMADDYIDSVVSAAARFYAPVARRCIVIGRGNHEQSILRNIETDVTTRTCAMMSALGGAPVIAGGYSGWVRFVAREHGRTAALTLWYHHGSGGASTMTLGVGAIRQQASYVPDADIVLGGHIHHAWHAVIGRLRLRSRSRAGDEVETVPQHHIRVGCYADDYGDGHSGWALEKGHAPRAQHAGVWLRLSMDARMTAGRRTLRLVPELTLAAY